MATKISSVQFERFKREAKKLSRELSIPHSQALDRLAAHCGFKNWSLLAKQCTAGRCAELALASPSTQANTPPVGNASAAAVRTRHYLHGDEVEGKPGKYFCRFCDLAHEANHFGSLVEHSDEDHGERYLAEVANWNRIRGEKYWLRRPHNPANMLKTAALAAQAAFEASRSPFHRWLELQTERDDHIGDLARDVLTDKRFPVGERHRRALEGRLAWHGEHVIRALRAAWREFEAGVGQSQIHQKSTQRETT